MTMEAVTQPTRPAVDCRALAKTYGEGDTAVQALRGIDLGINPGELMMLVGPSGCGKTTLISIIAGILDKTGGELNVFGENIAAMDAAARTAWRRDRIGFVFQSFNLMPALSATENVAIPLLIKGVPRKQALDRAAQMLERVGLGDRLDPSRQPGAERLDEHRDQRQQQDQQQIGKRGENQDGADKRSFLQGRTELHKATLRRCQPCSRLSSRSMKNEATSMTAAIAVAPA